MKDCSYNACVKNVVLKRYQNFYEHRYQRKLIAKDLQMRQLNIEELSEVSGGFKLNLGQALAAICVGWFAGGPVGLGFALSGVIMAQGINNLDELYKQDPLIANQIALIKERFGK